MIKYLLLLCRPMRIVGLLLLLFVLWWLFNGQEIISRDHKTAVNTICDNYIKQYPKLADFIENQRNKFGEFNTSVAIESLHGRTLNPEARRRSIEVRARLTSLYSKDPAGDESILWSHGTTLDTLGELPVETEKYLSQLERASHDDEYWSLVRNDPVALTSKLLRNDKNLRDDYRENREWYLAMMEVLMAMLEVKQEENSQGSGFIELDDLLQVASAGKPHLMQLVPKPDKTPLEACIYFETFRQFGEAIVMAAAEGVSPKETAEIIVLNRDALCTSDDEISGRKKIANPSSIASRLIELNRKRPDVWKAAQRDAYVLQFDRLTPGLSQSVLAKHPDLGAASLIVTQYPDLATQAASIVNSYGVLGMAVLVQYDGSEKFRKLLASSDVDHRIAMVAVLKSDVGLESVLEDPAYVDKWVGTDGKPLEDEYWVNVPLVGGIAKVAKNYGTGLPTDWSEIGWAAWDAADIALMVGSMGTSKIFTETAKQTAKQVAAKQAAKGVGKSAAKKLTRVRLPTKQTAMARLIAVIKASPVIKTIRWTTQTTFNLIGGSLTFGRQLVVAGVHTAKSIPPGVRRWAARGLLGASLFVRGPKQIKAILAAMSDYAKRQIPNLIDAIPVAIDEAIKKINKEIQKHLNGTWAILIFGVVLIGVGLLGFMLLFGISLPFGIRTSKTGS